MPRSRSRSRSYSRSPPRRRRRSRSRSHSPLPASSSSSRHRRHSSRERERDRDGEYSSSRRRGREEEGDRHRDRDRGRRNRASPSPPRRERGQGKETRWGERPAEGSGDVPSVGQGEEGRRDRTEQREESGRSARPEGGAREGAKGRGGGGSREGRRRERPVPFGEKPMEQEARYEWGKPAPSDDQEGDAEGGGEGGEGGKPKPPQLVAKPNFGLTGALATDSQTGNVYKGVVLKWTEPDDARKPEKGWRLYVFKEGVLKDTLHLHRQSAYLVGRHDVADLKVEHPSCSKQHAVIQFRRREDKEGGRGVVKPYLMDLESVNKTRLNEEEVPPARYVELRPQDMIQFGLSSREYVLMHEDMVVGK